MTAHSPRDELLFIITHNVTVRAVRTLTGQMIALTVSYFTFTLCRFFDGPQTVAAISALIALCNGSMLIATAFPMIGFERSRQRLNRRGSRHNG